MIPGNSNLKRELAALPELYERDPELFKKRSRELIEDYIASVPESERARVWGLQLRIDAELSHYRDPVARMNRMVEMFWDHVQYFLEVLDHPEKVLAERRGNRAQGKVLPFRSRKNLH